MKEINYELLNEEIAYVNDVISEIESGEREDFKCLEDFINFIKSDRKTFKYKNIALMICYYANSHFFNDINKDFFDCIIKAGKQNIPLVYPYLALLYYFGVYLKQDRNKALEYVDKFIESLNSKTIFPDDSSMFIEFLKMTSWGDEKECYNMLASFYIQLYKIAYNNPKLWQAHFDNRCIRKVVDYLTKAGKNGDLNANKNLYKFFDQVVENDIEKEKYTGEVKPVEEVSDLYEEIQEDLQNDIKQQEERLTKINYQDKKQLNIHKGLLFSIGLSKYIKKYSKLTFDFFNKKSLKPNKYFIVPQRLKQILTDPLYLFLKENQTSLDCFKFLANKYANSPEVERELIKCADEYYKQI